MAMLQAILPGYQERRRGPAAMLEHANRELLRKRFESTFVTAFMAVVDPERRVMTYSNAGHNRPERRRPDGSTTAIDGAVSVPLGISDTPDYEEATVPAGPGDTVVLYTDGITEAMAPTPSREMFGVRRLREALAACSGEPDCVIDSIHARLFEHTGSRDRADDQTLVAMRLADG
jgi:sigma-B regulation protein RsbU (phosphoserine phosphatase)